MTQARRNLLSADVRVEAFESRHLPLVTAFCEAYWDRPRTDRYYAWRYLACQPFSRMFLARTADECLGMIFAFRKRYSLFGEQVSCGEVFDWHSLPGLSGSAIGIRVLRAMMKQNERLFGIGGTPDARKALPAMGWQIVGHAIDYELPTQGLALADGLRRRVPVRLPGERKLLDAIVAAWFKPRRRGNLGVAERGTLQNLLSELESLYSGPRQYDLVQIPDAQWLEWLTDADAPVGNFQYWLFRVGGQLRGWSLTRTYETVNGKEGAIVEIFAIDANPGLYAWMISELSVELAKAGVQLIRARATCPVLQAGLKANRFRAGDSVPVFTYPKMTTVPARMHFTLNHTDACLRPYQTGRPDRFPATTPSALHQALQAQ